MINWADDVKFEFIEQTSYLYDFSICILILMFFGVIIINDLFKSKKEV